MRELRRRGASFTDFPSQLDGYIASLRRLPRERVTADYAKLRRFYFNHVHDPRREAAFAAYR